MTIIHMKFWATLAEFQTVSFTKCFEQRPSCWADCMKLHGDCFKGDNIDWAISVVAVEKFCPETILFYHV